MESVFQRRPTDSADHNKILLIALGLKSATRKLEQLLDEHAPPVADDGETRDPTELELALLGVIAFSESAKAQLERAALPADAPPARPRSERLTRALR
jgi:hypothetical protein